MRGTVQSVVSRMTLNVTALAMRLATKNPPDAEGRTVESGQCEPDGQRDVDHHAERLDPHESHRPALFAQTREGQARRHVEPDDGGHEQHVPGCAT